MSRVSDMVRRGKKYQAGTKLKFSTSGVGKLSAKPAKSKLYKPGTRVSLKGKTK